MRVWGVVFLLFFGAAACQLEEAPAPTPTEVKSQLGDSCQSNGECADDLVCSVGSRIAGLCTKACATSTECAVSFGDNTACISGFCVLECDVDADCLGGACDEYNGYCVTNGACDAGECGVSGKSCCNTATCTNGTCCAPTGANCRGAIDIPCCSATSTCNNLGQCT